MFFREVPASLPARGSGATGNYGGVGSARWFRAMSSRGGLAQGEDLRGFSLRGERTAGRTRMVILQDRSGSMEVFASEREKTLEQLFKWAPKHLRADDELAIVDFSDVAGVALAPTAVSALSPETVAVGCPPGGTLIAPAAEVAQELLDERMATWVAAISDGEVFDELDRRLKAAFRPGAIRGVLLINPAGVAVPDAWHRSFPHTVAIEMTSLGPGGVAVAVGRALAHVLGQDLKRGGRATKAPATASV